MDKNKKTYSVKLLLLSAVVFFGIAACNQRQGVSDTSVMQGGDAGYGYDNSGRGGTGTGTGTGGMGSDTGY